MTGTLCEFGIDQGGRGSGLTYGYFTISAYFGDIILFFCGSCFRGLPGLPFAPVPGGQLHREQPRVNKIGVVSPEFKVRIYGAGHPMIGTVLMLFFGLPSITRSLYAT